MKQNNNKKNYIVIAIILGILFIYILLKYNIGIPCIFHKLTGFYCPGCGMTRAFISLIKLDIYQAFRYNMLVIILVPFFIIYGVNKYILKNKYKIPRFIFYILLVITILFAILRNIPNFSFLAPVQLI